MAVIGYFKIERILFSQYLQFTLPYQLKAVNVERSQRKHTFTLDQLVRSYVELALCMYMYDAFIFMGTTELYSRVE